MCDQLTIRYSSRVSILFIKLPGVKQRILVGAVGVLLTVLIFEDHWKIIDILFQYLLTEAETNILWNMHLFIGREETMIRHPGDSHEWWTAFYII